MKCVQTLDLLSWFIQDTFVDSVRNTIIYQFRQNKAILALVEHLESVCGKRKKITDIRVASKNSIYVSCELSSFVFVDGVGYVCRRTLYLDSSPDATFGDMARCASSASRDRCGRAWVTDRFAICWSGTQFRDELLYCSISHFYKNCTNTECFTNINIVFEFHSARAIKLNLFQGLSNNIIGLALGLLGSLYDSRLVQITSVIEIQLLERILKRKDFALFKLREFPA